MRLRGCWLGVSGFRVWGCEASGLLGRVSGFFSRDPTMWGLLRGR